MPWGGSSAGHHCGGAFAFCDAPLPRAPIQRLTRFPLMGAPPDSSSSLNTVGGEEGGAHAKCRLPCHDAFTSAIGHYALRCSPQIPAAQEEAIQTHAHEWQGDP